MTAEKMTELNGRKIAFPDARSLADLFDDVIQIDPRSGLQAPTVATFPSWDKGNRSKSYLSGYMTVGAGHSFHVKPKSEVVEFIRNNMLHGSNDRIYFRVVVWENGEALVMAEYNQIIGSSYLAVIDAATIPTKAD